MSQEYECLKKTILDTMEYIKVALDDLQEEQQTGNGKDDQLIQGMKTAYVECLSMLMRWKGAKQNGFDWDAEKRYPL